MRSLGHRTFILGGLATAVSAAAAAYGQSARAATQFLLLTAIAGRWGAPACVALVGYLAFAGFVVNRLGELTWPDPADAGRITALIAAVVLGRIIGDSVRLYRVFADTHAEREIERARRHDS